MYNNAIPTYHRGERNYGTGYDMMKRIDELEEAIQRSVIKLERDGMQPGWGVVKDWLRAALHRGAKP
jgi:hypothetical protein